MTLLSTTTLSGATTTVSSISGSYKSLVGYIFGVSLSGADFVRIKPNATDATGWNGLAAANIDTSGNDWTLNGSSFSMVASNTNNAWTFRIDNYASTTNYKPVNWSGAMALSAGVRGIIAGGAFKSNTAITSLEISAFSGATYSAGTLLLYGVN